MSDNVSRKCLCNRFPVSDTTVWKYVGSNISGISHMHFDGQAATRRYFEIEEHYVCRFCGATRTTKKESEDD